MSLENDKNNQDHLKGIDITRETSQNQDHQKTIYTIREVSHDL